jgi:hypothetical protein
VLSPDEPPPTLSPVSNSATGNFVAAIASRTAAAGSGIFSTMLSRDAHRRSAKRCACFCASSRSPSVTTVTLGPIYGTSPYWYPPMTLTERIFGLLCSRSIAALVMGRSGSAYVF